MALFDAHVEAKRTEFIDAMYEGKDNFYIYNLVSVNTFMTYDRQEFKSFHPWNGTNNYVNKIVLNTIYNVESRFINKKLFSLKKLFLIILVITIGIGIILVLSHRIVAVNGNLKMSNAKYCKIDGTEVTDKDLKNLKYMTKLQRLELLTPKITDISFVSEMKDLRSFSVESQNITNLSSINNCQNLQTLNLYHTNLTSLKDLAENSNLRVLDVYTGNPLLNISDLHHLPKLEQLSISSSKLIDISPISELSDLKILELSCCSIKDLSPLGDCVKIQKLNLTGCEQISDLSPITKLDTLEEINLSGTSISDFSVLLSIKGLKKVVADNGQIDPSILSKLKSQNVIVDIV